MRDYIEWWTREYRCANGVCEKTKFPVRTEREPSAYSGRERRRRVRRAEKNETQAKHEAARIVNNNFRAGRDYLFTGTVDDAGMEKLVMRAGTDDPDEILLAMRKEIANLVRRTKRALDGTGKELRYWAVASDTDGKDFTPVRAHVHIIVNAEAAEAMAKAWKLGNGGLRKLYAARYGDMTELVEYLLAQVRVVGSEKRYIPSRNLRKPQAGRPYPARNPDAELRVPKNCALIYRSEQRAGRPQKIRYYRPEADRARRTEPPDEGDEPGGDAR